MSESQRIAELRARLNQIEQTTPVNEALPLLAPAAIAGARAAAPAIARGASSLAGKAKSAFQNFKRGMAGQQPRTAAGTFTQAGGATKAGQAVTAAGQAIKNNLGKASAAGAAAAGAAGYMAGKAGQPTTPPVGTKPAAPDQSDAETARLARQNAAAAPKPPVGTKPAAAAPVALAAPAAALSPQEEGEMGVLAQELSSLMGQDPELDNLILQYEKLRPGAAGAQP